MAEQFINIAIQVSATLLLGAFFGLERRMRGYPDASRLHAATAAAGLLAMIAFRPEATPLVTTMTVAIGLSFALVGAIRAGVRALSFEQDIHAGAGADTFTLAGAMAAGCACGTGDVRSVAAVMLLMAVASIFRPLETFQASPLASGQFEGNASAAAATAGPFAANDDTPATGGGDAGRTGSDR